MPHPQPHLLYSREVFGRLAGNKHLRGLKPADFLHELADLSSAINALHPFREGNGRALGAFLGQLAGNAGYLLDWSELNGPANVAASIAGYRGDNGPLRELLAPLVYPRSSS
ncbi:Fic family protein [Yinghuangia sp. ASG 101]|uniref:Fic family protein n=1 Tax=Yinghuangia sp. ASG 101 TaxID=2896848 RepID=UPI002F90D3BE